jgi:ferrous iron transport protein B
MLIFILWVTYELVGRLGAADAVNFLQRRVFGVIDPTSGAYGGWVNGPLSRELARLAPPRSLVYDFFFGGQAGLMSTGVTYSLAIVLPIVTLFFLAFALMEDSGYLPRLSLLLDRIFKSMGLSGKAVLPMVLGLGCGTMATIGTRILETRRQRLIAILLLALAVPCSAQLGVITATLAGISPTGVLMFAIIIILSMFGAGWAAARILPGEGADLLIEVPPFRWPSPLNVVVKTAHRVKWFMREAVPLFLLGTVFLFVADKTGLLKLIQAGARPVVTGVLGLPATTTEGFVMAFLRRDYGAIIIREQFTSHAITADQALIALVVITLFVPCLAHFFICIKELGWRRAVLMDALVFTLAFLIGGLLRAFLTVTGIHVAPGP